MPLVDEVGEEAGECCRGGGVEGDGVHGEEVYSKISMTVDNE